MGCGEKYQRVVAWPCRASVVSPRARARAPIPGRVTPEKRVPLEMERQMVEQEPYARLDLRSLCITTRRPAEADLGVEDGEDGAESVCPARRGT